MKQNQNYGNATGNCSGANTPTRSLRGENYSMNNRSLRGTNRINSNHPNYHNSTPYDMSSPKFNNDNNVNLSPSISRNNFSTPNRNLNKNPDQSNSYYSKNIQHSPNPSYIKKYNSNQNY